MTPQKRLQKLIEKNRIPHALLLSGPKSSNKEATALSFAIDIVGDKSPHPDIHYFYPEGKSGLHPITNIRKLSETVALAPYSAEKKVFFIHDAERMQPASSNALLKTLEEPTDSSILILLTAHPEKILSTILSRCQQITFLPPAKAPYHPILDVLAQKKPIDSLDPVEEPDLLFETLLLWYRDRYLLSLPEGGSHLHFPTYKEHIEQAPLLPLEKVEQKVKEAKLAFERSMKLSLILETFFYQLN